MTRRGMTLAEIVVAAGVVALIAVPLLSMLAASDHEAMTSEDYMIAQAVASRHLAEVSAIPWRDLVGQLPIRRVLSGVPAGDEAIAARHPEYARLFSGASGLTGVLAAEQVEEGLVAIEVMLEWAVRPGAAGRRRYGLVRMRARADQSIRSSYPFGEAWR
jgi:hypothetical protein